ncbi:MAG TPA: hypothetical protein VMF10_04895 [Candidatus Aquilonibacter sp.]|nr:hypothetical protein [Candidatus Aquilonibacter sp.]
MPVPRLLALVVLFTLCAGTALAQSPQNNLSNLVVFQGAASMDVVEKSMTGTPQASPGRIASEKQTAPESALLANAANQLSRSYKEPGVSLGPDTDRTCYFIRDYVMIRDSPHSDSVHRDGSFTCVPGARFHVYTTALPALKIIK